MSSPADTFRQEATDILETLEDHLLELEADPTNRTLVDTIFRALHTIKGSGEMFGFSMLARFVHHFENAYDLVRSDKAEVTPDLINISLSSRDHISALLDATDGPAAEAVFNAPEGQELLKRIGAFTSGDGAVAEAPSAEEEENPAEVPTSMLTYEIHFKPEATAIRNGMRPDLVIEELAQLGSCTSQIIGNDVPTLEDVDPVECYIAWRIELTTEATREQIEDIFLFFDEGIVEISAPEPSADGPSEEEAPATEAAEPETKDAASEKTAPRKAAPSAASRAPAAAKVDSVKVQAHRLDDLMDQLGELVIAQARLNRISERLGEQALAGAAEEIERLVTGMRDATLSIRMLPIGGVFSSFRRVVRDLAAELGKNVSLVTEGGDTELDKTIIDRLSEPLVHIIRNSADHGIESAEDRAAAGKPEQATLHMSARQTGGEVLISVSDDGGGLKTEVIRKRGIERGLISEEDEPSDDAIHQLIFAPGFSTAATVSSVSGRGVGMDAVRNFIEELRGAVEVKSERGVGTTVTLRMPLTLAIIDGLLVRVGDGNFVIPLASVEECVELSADEASNDRQRSIINIRNELVPFLKLNEIFGLSDEESTPNRIVIVNADGRRVGLLLNDIIGQHQTVIKSLSVYHRNVEGLAGCTILGDGSVALIIDPLALVKGYSSQNREAA